MSKISPDFIHSVGYLYEEINIQQQDFLNEESEYYDEEATELVEDILSSICLSMVYEGYSASAVIGFLADSSEEDIIEKYLNFDESILNESTVSEEYINEQLEILNEFVGALFRVGKALVKGAKYAKGATGAAPLTRLGAGLKAAGTATERIAKQGPRASSIVRSTLSKGVQKVKDIAKGAKAALTGPTAKKIALGAAGLGAVGLAGGAGGYIGAKLAGAGSGSGSQDAPKSSTGADKSKWNASAALGGKAAFSAGGGAAKMKQNPKMTAADIQKQGMINIRNKKPASTPPAAPATPSGSSGGSGSAKAPAPATPAPSSGKSAFTQWAEANPKLAPKVNPGQSGYEDIQKANIPGLDKPRAGEKQDQTPTQGSSTAQIDKSSVDKDIEAEKKRQAERAQKAMSAATTSTTQKESYEPYDIILNYLLSEGHADNLDEANYIMLEMDTDAIGTIMQEYYDYILAEEIQEWVNELVEEGYDLSEYTWDDMVEYYVNN